MPYGLRFCCHQSSSVHTSRHTVKCDACGVAITCPALSDEQWPGAAGRHEPKFPPSIEYTHAFMHSARLSLVRTSYSRFGTFVRHDSPGRWNSLASSAVRPSSGKRPLPLFRSTLARGADQHQLATIAQIFRYKTYS